MARKLSATEIFDELEVDLWGNLYTLRTITRSISEQVDVERSKLDDIDDNDTGQIARALITLVGIILKPKGDAPPADELLTGRWEADELGIDWLHAFNQSLQEEAAARRRPTHSSPAKQS